MGCFSEWKKLDHVHGPRGWSQEGKWSRYRQREYSVEPGLEGEGGGGIWTIVGGWTDQRVEGFSL